MFQTSNGYKIQNEPDKLTVTKRFICLFTLMVILFYLPRLAVGLFYWTPVSTLSSNFIENLVTINRFCFRLLCSHGHSIITARGKLIQQATMHMSTYPIKSFPFCWLISHLNGYHDYLILGNLAISRKTRTFPIPIYFRDVYTSAAISFRVLKHCST